MTANPGHGEWKARLEVYLKASGGRISGPRMKVAEVFFSMAGHPGIEELSREVRRRHKGIGHATIYRTMKVLCDSGLVAIREFGEGFARFEAVVPDCHHDHLICTSCGKVIEFTDAGIESIQERVSREHGFEMHDHRLQIFGICAACRGGG